MTVAAILLATALAAPQVEVSTVDDRTVTGTVAGLDASKITVKTDGTAASVPLESVLEVRFAPPQDQPPAKESELVLRLNDGGRLSCRQIVLEDRTFIADTLMAGTVKSPLAAVQAVRFRPADPPIEQKWSELLESAPERDLLVVRNGDVLDRLEGTISALDEKNLTFLVGETRVPIDRTKPKLFGVIVGRGPVKQSAKVAGEVRFRNGDRLPVTSFSLKGSAIELVRTDGGTSMADLASLSAIDFGRGKVQFLSQIEPREKQHSPIVGTELDSVFDVRIDRSDAGPQTPIRIDGRTFQRGLVIHSRTRLTYRLNGDYRRFVAVAGIEELVRPNGKVTLTISADGEELFSSDVAGTDPAIPLDLDVSGRRELTIFVDFGGDWDDGDHLALGDARLIK